MAKLIGAGSISGYVPKMIELRHGYIINGQYYTGEEMQAVPFCTVYNGNYNYLSNLSMFLNQSHGVGGKTNLMQTAEKNIFYDKFDEEVCYVCLPCNDRNYNLVLKVRESKEECTIEGIHYVCGYTTASDCCTLVDVQQKEPDKIIFIFNEKYLSSTCRFNIITYNTTPFSVYKHYYGNTNSYFYTATKIDENLYFIAGYSHFCAARVKEDFTSEVKSISSECGSSNSYLDICPLNTMKSETDEEFIYKLYYYVYSSSITTFNKNVLVTITVNKQTNEMSISSKTVVTDTEAATPLVRQGAFNYMYTIEGSTKKYLAHFISYTSITSCYFTLYEIQEDENLKVLKSYQIAQNVALNLLFKNNGKRVLIPSMTGTGVSQTITRVAILDWNEAKEDFVVTKSIEDSIQTFGYNKNDELFVLKKDMSIDKYNDTSVAAFNATFAESYYRYQGENILTHITCSITNLEDEKLAKKVFLELEGAAYFTDNNKKEIEFTTSATEVTTVNVTISGPGAINIYPKIEA